jgi:fatty acid desaturase
MSTPPIRVPGRPGEEFREDTRTAPARLLPEAVIEAITQLDDARSWRAIAGTAVTIAVTVGVAVAWWTPWVVLPAVVVIASRQHALFVLAHDAAHYRLLSDRRWNDRVGQLLAACAGLSMHAYRVVHRLHHNHLYGSADPDIALHGGYPRGKAYLRHKLLVDLCGLTAWKTYRYFFGAPAANAVTGAAQRPLDDTSPGLRAAAIRDRWSVGALQASVPLLVLAVFGTDGLFRYAVLWILPAITGLQAQLRLRAIFEHGAPCSTDSPFGAARTVLAGPVMRFFLFPHHVQYHIEHHLLPAVPHYRLPRLHAALREAGLLEAAQVCTLAQAWRRIYADPAS